MSGYGSHGWMMVLLLTWPAFAQQGASPSQPQPVAEPGGSTLTLRTTVRRVIVDVVVTDAQGRPVPGLKLSDFSIKEDGKPQQPLSFDVHGFGLQDDYTPVKLPPSPPNTFINLPTTPERGPLYVLLYDLVNTELADQIFARKQLIRFIQNKPPGARFAIFVFSDGLHLVQGFTADKDKLLASVDPHHPRSHVPMVFLMGVNNGQGDPKTTQEVFDFIGRYLEGLPGRKNLIWLSGGFPLSLFASDDDVESYQAQTRQMLDRLARDQVAIYPVSARGVIVTQENSLPGATSSSPDAPGQNHDSRDATGNAPASSTQAAAAASAAAANQGFSMISAAQFTEDEVARETGGRAYYSTNDVAGALAEATDSGEDYYTLSYSPTDRDYNGKLRSIDVELDKHGYHLAYRRAYYGTKPNPEPQPQDYAHLANLPETEQRQPGDSLSANMEPGAPMAHQIVFGAHLRALDSPTLGTPEQMARLADQPAFTAGHKRRSNAKPLAPVKLQTLAIDYAVIARQFAIGGQSQPPELEVAAAAYDTDGRILNSIVNNAVESDAPADSAAKKVYRIEQRLAVPVNAVSLRVALRDAHTDRIGSMEIPLPLKPESQASVEDGGQSQTHPGTENGLPSPANPRR